MMPCLVIAMAGFGVVAHAQVSPLAPPPSAQAGGSPAAQDLLQQLLDFRLELETLRVQLAETRREAEALRRDLDAVRGKIAQDQELLGAKVEDQEQTKVESGSKYHVRLSGLALLTVFSTRGGMDNLDVPRVAMPRSPGDAGGSFSAGVRQSLIGLQVFGPTVGGAKTTADLALDFFGGFPASSDGLTAPLVRLRTAKITMDWRSVSIVGGQDGPFFSPQAPTSLVSTAYPGLSASGNLWTWTPQLYVERRLALSDDAAVTLRGGILDPLTGEPPASEYERLPTAGERSRVPALATRVGWLGSVRGNPGQFGAGAYYARQNWGFNRTVEAWAATADWDLPLGRWVGLSGEFYRGRALGGLGGGASAGVLFNGLQADPASAPVPLETTGGWLQWKVKPTARLEFNGALGEDNPSCSAASRQLTSSPGGFVVCRNRSAFVNTILQPRSNVLFSVEYRRLWTTEFSRAMWVANHVSFSMGIGF
jgi:hypothetical protein